MTYLTIRKCAVVVVFACISSISLAQDPGPKTKSANEISTTKPFRILTNGQRITIQSNKNISNLIVWTASGNRFVEQTNVQASSYNFVVPSKEKYVFVMLQLEGGKRYTEKIGVRE
jgi:hypothetical protein